MRLDRAVFGELELGPHEPVVELARLDLQGLHVAGDLLAVAHVHDLEGAETLLVGRAVDQHDEVRGQGERHRLRCRRRELDAREVDAGRRPRDLAQLDVLDEQRRDDPHRVEPTRPPARASPRRVTVTSGVTRHGRRSEMTGHAGSISPRANANFADVGAAWWLLWSPSPHVIKASHCKLVAPFACGRRPKVWVTAFTAALSMR